MKKACIRLSNKTGSERKGQLKEESHKKWPLHSRPIKSRRLFGLRCDYASYLKVAAHSISVTSFIGERRMWRVTLLPAKEKSSYEKTRFLDGKGLVLAIT